MKKRFLVLMVFAAVLGRVLSRFRLCIAWVVLLVLFFSHQCDRVLIARDTRISGASFQVALQAGLSSVGVASEALGVLPTPAVAFLAKQEKIPSAS